jgi:anti-anti-sigma regulatory factor
MTTIAAPLIIDEQFLAHSVHEAAGKLNGDGSEFVLDFSSVHRIDSGGITAIESLACKADDAAVTVVLKGVTADVYKALKLVKLAARVSFTN